MEYMLLIYSEEQRLAAMPAAQRDAVTGAYMAYAQALQEAKVMVGANRLRPASAATSVRVADGRNQVVDGPFAETKEQLGGYFLIDVPDLDAALKWAARCPGTQHGTVEVRPVWAM